MSKKGLRANANEILDRCNYSSAEILKEYKKEKKKLIEAHFKFTPNADKIVDNNFLFSYYIATDMLKGRTLTHWNKDVKQEDFERKHPWIKKYNENMKLYLVTEFNCIWENVF